ncbi:MAG: hypothetical protein LBJ02_05060 [Bifidobacteriaceae bacterium]|jgi:hypothetical protein|nr:hypothetical protein [Bifidobacteriaceae bacterium]
MKLLLNTRAGCVATLAAVGLVLAGCGGDEQSAAPEPEASPTAVTQDATGGPAANPGVSGTIAAVTDSLLQVQDSEKQTAVAYTADTAITEEVAGTQSDVVVGSCVSAIGAAAGAEDDSPDTVAETFAAQTITVTPAGAAGSCAGGLGRAAGGGQRSGGPGELPEGMPSGMPTGEPFPDGGGQGFGGVAAGNMVFGMVTAVDGETVTVEQPGVPAFGAGGQEEAKEQDSSASMSRSFTMGTAVITATKPADASALQVGKCVAAQGEADRSGKVLAESLAVSEPGENGCAIAGGGRFRSGAGGPMPDGSTGANSGARAGGTDSGPGRMGSPGHTDAPGAATTDEEEEWT